jgi:hypothetical protein
VTWFKVDDGFWSHPKTLALSPNAVALWVRAGSYCGKHLTDGYIAASLLPMLQGTSDDAAELIDAGLWKAAKKGYVFHDWDQYQDTRDAVEKRREAWKERQRKHRKPELSTGSQELIHSIPFPSKGTRDSRRESPRDLSKRQPPSFAEAMKALEDAVARDEGTVTP